MLYYQLNIQVRLVICVPPSRKTCKSLSCLQGVGICSDQRSLRLLRPNLRRCLKRVA